MRFGLGRKKICLLPFQVRDDSLCNHIMATYVAILTPGVFWSLCCDAVEANRIAGA